MWRFRTIDPEHIQSELTSQAHYVSVVGAGGKTTLIEYLAAEAIRHGKKVAVTTTTKIWAREPYVLWAALSEGRMRSDFVRVGKAVADGKLTALQVEEVEELGTAYDLVLIEADGAKRKPLKYPEGYEPVIPPCSDRVIVVAGLDALSGRADEKIFRWELFERATGVAGDARITPSLFLRFFENDGLMKGVDREKCVVVLNKYDACEERHAVTDLAKEVLAKSGARRLIIASVLFETFYGAERVRA